MTTMESAATAAASTYVETSLDGVLLVEVDRAGFVRRIQIEPEVNATWTADQLAERLFHLYTVALMRCRSDVLSEINAAGADRPPDANYPSRDEVAAYRAQWIRF